MIMRGNEVWLRTHKGELVRLLGYDPANRMVKCLGENGKERWLIIQAVRDNSPNFHEALMAQNPPIEIWPMPAENLKSVCPHCYRFVTIAPDIDGKLMHCVYCGKPSVWHFKDDKIYVEAK